MSAAALSENEYLRDLCRAATSSPLSATEQKSRCLRMPHFWLPSVFSWPRPTDAVHPPSRHAPNCTERRISAKQPSPLWCPLNSCRYHFALSRWPCWHRSALYQSPRDWRCLCPPLLIRLPRQWPSLQTGSCTNTQTCRTWWPPVCLPLQPWSAGLGAAG